MPCFLETTYCQTILNLKSQPHKTNWIKWKQMKNHLRVPNYGIMPTTNLNFTMVLDTINTILLSSTQPIHLNTKRSQSSFFVPNPIGPKISNANKNFLKKHFNGLVIFSNHLLLHFWFLTSLVFACIIVVVVVFCLDYEKAFTILILTYHITKSS